MSGGVDSSVAMQILREEGHELEAFYLKIWLEDELSYLGNCPWEEDLKFVESICAKSAISLRIVPLQKEYFERIVTYVLAELKAGRTPNPDLMCNQRIKFGAFLEYLSEAGNSQFEAVASGHYAKKEELHDISWLRMARDRFKDQTYFLAGLSQKQLRKLVFPIGDLLKSEVRTLARQFNLPNQNRKDSQGICFLGKIEFADFVRHHLGIKKGEIVEYESGNILGEHEGVWFYTLGQRKGIGLSGGPWYAVKKDLKKNIVFVSNKYFAEDKCRDEFEVSNFNWISQQFDANGLRACIDLGVKLRHGEKIYRVLDIQDVGCGGGDARRMKVIIDGQDQGIAAGQYAVFYNQEFCLGCAVICER